MTLGKENSQRQHMSHDQSHLIWFLAQIKTKSERHEVTLDIMSQSPTVEPHLNG